ncbi:DUF1573 domain-containing protein [Gaetbulibacter sp. M235]|uniref:DUF1573 domain-containing protein n=1 Tax=Gaetbulibacter sp. M235 TaxID=3126510 RepID=UPI00374E59A8
MNQTINQLQSMKIKFLLIICLLIYGTNFSQEAKASDKVGVLSFTTTEIDYGTIHQNDNGERIFTFKNTGDAPIVISNAKGSCGCTVPTYSRNMVPPGETGEIKVKYDTNRIGKFSKTVTLTSNASEPTTILKIKGEVLSPAN